MSDLVRKARLSRLPGPPRHRPGLKSVLQALADDCQNPFGRDIFTGVKTIAAECEFSVRTAQKLLAGLVTHTVIVKQAKATQHRPTTYRLNLELLRAISCERTEDSAVQDTQAAVGVQGSTPLSTSTGVQGSSRLSESGVQEISPGMQKVAPGVQEIAPEVQALAPEHMNSKNKKNGRSPLENEPEHDVFLMLLARAKETVWQVDSKGQLLEFLQRTEKIADEWSGAAARAVSLAWTGRVTGGLKRPHHGLEAAS